ncbi:hypothetical protein C464_16627 [Halorubrum coriense DSM 10284]|uniref:Uncharacterized protein n=1 Tax=Halorubrum coriense DSM 10284 TaxID=1227466 RepID=M0E6E2_9EURY|nr:hypothetical protein [Halorubrum coriense]ELZ43370.1 hypothetical protein C464_16627 [Halorubrum coriense DSM 10284]
MGRLYLEARLSVLAEQDRAVDLLFLLTSLLDVEADRLQIVANDIQYVVAFEPIVVVDGRDRVPVRLEGSDNLVDELWRSVCPRVVAVSNVRHRSPLDARR